MLRHRRTVIATVALALLAAACGDDEGDSPQGGGTDGDATTTSAPVDGGTLVAAIDSDPGSLNPAITTSGAVHVASELMFNGLVELDDEGTPQPELAESWEISDDGTVYTFTLREGVTWHDGEPFTAEDVVYTFNEVLLDLHSRTAASVGSNVASIEAPDDDTVVFTFDAPYAPLLQQLDVTEAPILPAHVYEGTDPATNPANLEPVGTGPFEFVSYTPGTEIRLAAFDDYFKEGLPRLDEVVLRVITDRATALAALEQGEVDFLFSAPGPDRERLLADDAYGSLETSINPGGSNCIMTISFNLERPIVSDLEVRRALFHALDRDVFVDRVLFGDGEVAAAPISSGIRFAHAEDIELPSFDPEEAASLLESAGWADQGGGTRTAQGVDGVEDGTPLAIDLLHFPTFADYAQLIRSQLAEVGVEVELRPLDPPVFAETVFTGRDFDTNLISYCNGSDPEIGVRRMYDSQNIRPVPFTNAAGYANPEIDRLFAEAARTIEPSERTPIYREIQEILAEDLPYIWVVETRSTRVFTARCQDFGPSGHFAETASCRR